jgi:hypothetical protein
MKTKLFMILVFMVAATSLAVFTATKALGFSDEPCYGLNYDYCPAPLMTQAVTIVSTTWTVTLLGEPTKIPGMDYYEWIYSFTGPSGGISGSNFIAMLIPDCCKVADKIQVILGSSSPNNLSYSEVGKGEPTLKFGTYNQQARVLKGTPDANNQWKIVTNTQYKTRSTIIIKYGNTVFPFEMAVPGCPLATGPQPIGGRTYTECVNMGQETTAPFYVPGDEGPLGPYPADHDDISFYIVRNMDRDGCISEIWGCIGHDCLDCKGGSCDENLEHKCEKMDWESLPPKTILEASLLRTCPDENLSKETGSPYTLITINSAGYSTKKCLDLNSGLWTYKCCCSHTCTDMSICP